MDDKETIAKIKSLARRSSVGAEVVTITPTVAEWILEHNWHHNRSIAQGTIDKYAAAMRHGNWSLTGDGISFSNEGVAINGQHRMWAVIESGMSVPFLCVFGLDPDAARNMDCGRIRSMAFRTGLPPQISGTLGFLIDLAYGREEVSQSNILTLDGLYGEAIRQVIALQKRKVQQLRSVPVVAAAALWYLAGESAYITRQYGSMMDLDSSNCSPACAAFMRQCAVGRLAPRAIVQRDKRLGLFIKAFSAFNPRNSRLTRISFRDGNPTIDAAKAMVLDAMAKAKLTLDATPKKRRRFEKKPEQLAA